MNMKITIAKAYSVGKKCLLGYYLERASIVIMVHI